MPGKLEKQQRGQAGENKPEEQAKEWGENVGNKQKIQVREADDGRPPRSLLAFYARKTLPLLSRARNLARENYIINNDKMRELLKVKQ